MEHDFFLMFLWEMSEKYGIGGEALVFSKIFMGEHGKITFSRNSSGVSPYSWGVRQDPYLMDVFRGE